MDGWMDGQVGSIDFGGGKGGLRKLVVLAFTYYTFFFYLPLHTYTTFFFCGGEGGSSLRS